MQKMKTNHITVKTAAEAWAQADRLFPCDYMHDSARSSRAGYNIYMSTCADHYAWISDLGDRLEVNLENGETVNIWIVPEDLPEEITAEKTAEDEAAEYERFTAAVYDALSGDDDTAAETAAEAARRFIPDALNAEVCQRVTVIVNGGRLASCEDEKRIYNALRDGEPLALDILTRYAESACIRWGCIRCESVQHVQHGSTGGGHFCITGTITARAGEELSFLTGCADILNYEHDSRRA